MGKQGLGEILQMHVLHAPKDLHCHCGLNVTGVSYEVSIANWAEHVAQLISREQTEAEADVAAVNHAYREYVDAPNHDLRSLARAHLFHVLNVVCGIYPDPLSGRQHAGDVPGPGRHPEAT